MENKEKTTETNNSKTKKRIKISSEAFPPKSYFESKKIQPAHSSIHRYLKEENIEINDSMVKLRKIHKKDMEQIRPLFKEWFPLDYDESFFEKIFLRLEEESGLSLIAYITNPKFKEENNENGNLDLIKKEVREINNLSKSKNDYIENFSIFHELIIGVIITNKESFENYIQRVPYKYENLSYLDEFSTNSKYFIYVQSLGVIDECRRLKLGTLLLNEIIKIHYLDYDCLGIYLHVVVYNQTAIKFYEKNKFREINHIFNYYQIEGKYYDSKVMGRLFHKNEKLLKSNLLIRFLELVLINPIKISLLLITLFNCCRRFRHIRKFK